MSCVDSMFLYVYIDLWNYIFKICPILSSQFFMGVNIRETTGFPFFVPPLLSHYYHSHTTLLLTLMVTKRVEAFSHQAFVCDLSWMSYNSMQFWHYLPRDSIRFHRLKAQFHRTASHTSDTSCKARLSSVLLINLL